MKLHTFKIGGIHPAENKIAAGKPIENIPLPEEVVLPVSQHIGAPAKPVVKKGDKVKRGDRVAEAGGFVSAHIHTPISGTVVKVDVARTPQGMPVEAIYIKSDEADREADAAAMADKSPKRSDAEIAALESKQIIDLIKEAGIVGLGGATFPAHVKLSPPPGSKAEVVIINAAECEPCLSCDDMLMRENAAEIAKGVALLVKAAGVDRGIIAIENNKPEAIAAMTAAVATHPGLEVMPMMVKYPQGGEKQLIEAVIGKEVELMISKALEMPEGPERDELSLLIANHMKKLLLAVSKDGVDDAKIFKDLAEYSHGMIRLDPAAVRLHDFKIIAPPSSGKKKKKK